MFCRTFTQRASFQNFKVSYINSFCLLETLFYLKFLQVLDVFVFRLVFSRGFFYIRGFPPVY